MLALVGAGTLGAKYKDHWKSGLAALGVIEALTRSLNVLDGLELEASGGMNHEGNGNKSTREERERRQQEIKHLLCFWMLFASISLLESIRTLPASTNNNASTLTSWGTLRDAVEKLRKGLWRNIPSLVPPTPAARARRPFPQPSSFPLPLALPSIPSLLPPKVVLVPTPLPTLPSMVRSISTRKSVKYALLKLLVLWIGLRKDGFGASAIWDWVLGPLFAVKRSRGTGGGNVTKVIQVQVVTKSTTPTTTLHKKSSSQSRFEQPRPNQQDLFSSSSLTPQGAITSYLTTPTSVSSISSSSSSDSSSSHQTISPHSQNPQTPSSSNHKAYSPFSPTSSTAFSSPASLLSMNSHSHARDRETHFPSPAGVAYRITSSTRPIFGRSESGEGKGYYVGEGEGNWEDDTGEGEETEGEADKSW